METLTTQETARREELEKQIESNISMVGRALFEIRESRLYRETHGTFEEYCKERFAMNRDYINKQIRAAEVVSNLDTNGIQNKPNSERQARPLAKLPPEDQPAAWEKAKELAKEEGKPVAARHVEKAVEEVMPKKEPEPEADKEPLVVDESKPDKARRIPKWIPDDAERLWLLAKTDIEKILPTDRSRERVLQEVIAYAQTRIDQNK
jgi:hypothetical protein